LAELGWFSIARLGLLWLLLTLDLLYFCPKNPVSFLWINSHLEPGNRVFSMVSNIVSRLRTRKIFFLPMNEKDFLSTFLLLLWVPAALWLFFRPHEFIIGGADAGVYVNLAASIAESGRIVINDTILADLDPALYPALLRALPPTDNASIIAPYYVLPGFYIIGEPAGQITPQFFHLHPVWQAVAYELGGVRAALMLTGLWASAGSLAVYLLVRHLSGQAAALLALLILSLNALQVWFARYPTTEMLTQFLLWTALWALLLWLRALTTGQQRQEVALFGLLAGLAMGQLFLVRIDMYFLLAVPGLLWLGLWRSGRPLSITNWFFLPLGLLTSHSLIHAAWQSRPYSYNLFAYGLNLLKRNWLLPLVAILILAGVLLLFGRYAHHLSRLARYRRPLLLAAVTGIILLAVYGWFLRPSLGQAAVRADWFGGGQWPPTDHEHLLRLGWYLSPIGLCIAILGTCLMIWRMDRQTAVLLAVGLTFSLLYLWRIQANPHQIYASRRYVPVTLPFAIVAGAYFLNTVAHYFKSLSKKQVWPAAVVTVLALLWLAGTGWAARGFISQVDYRGIITQVEELNEQLDPNSILIFNDTAAVTKGDIIGTPLQFLHGHTVYSLRDPLALNQEIFRTAVAGWQAAGHTVYWVGPPGPIDSLTGPPFTVTIQSQHLEGTYDHKPVNIVRPQWLLEISKVSEREQIQP
jgi:4-amino-4-deoxy-L-arabinose transferase-like glycosyltransferase